MNAFQNKLIDNFGRKHKYLRISLTDRCNLRCTYCMPEEGLIYSKKEELATPDELYTLAKTFVNLGVQKIRITGGEPLIRKDVNEIIKKLSSLDVELALTTNGVIIDRFIDLFQQTGLQKINLSLDTLSEERFARLTRRGHFKAVMKNLDLLSSLDFELKINVVLMKGVNEDEVVDFIELTRDNNIQVRFIEFMPFDGNMWDINKMVSLDEILTEAYTEYTPENVVRISDRPNDTTKNYSIKSYKGTFGIISSVTNPFCDTCDRIRLTANGKIKNCLFSSNELDLLGPLRQGMDIHPIIFESLSNKAAMRGGMDTLDKLKNPQLHEQNRSMIAIGG